MARTVLYSDGILMLDDGTPIAPSLSAQQTIALWASPKTSVGAWTTDFNNLAPFSLSSGAQNDSISYDFITAGGVYTLDFLHLIGPNRGIYTVAIDGVTVGTVDGYAADYLQSENDASLSKPLMTTLTGIGLSGASHVLSFTMATKNASASAYYGCVSAAVFTW